MTDEEFLNAQRKLTIDSGNQVLRLLKADVDIMEIARDVLGVARDEIKDHPTLFFQTLGGGSPAADADQSDLGIHDEAIGGGQTGGTQERPKPAEPKPENPWIELIKKQKDLLAPLIPKILK